MALRPCVARRPGGVSDTSHGRSHDVCDPELLNRVAQCISHDPNLIGDSNKETPFQPPGLERVVNLNHTLVNPTRVGQSQGKYRLCVAMTTRTSF